MGATVNPAVSGVGYGRWGLHAALYTLGVCCGATIVYAVAAAAYHLLGGSVRTWLILAIPLLGLVVLRDLGLRVRVPYREGVQVPEWVRQMLGAGSTAFAYGIHLGIGFLTRFTYSGHLAFVLVLPLLDWPGPVLAAVATFGIGKAVVVFTSVAGKTYPEYERRILFRYRRRTHGYTALRVANAGLAISLALVLIMHA